MGSQANPAVVHCLLYRSIQNMPQIKDLILRNELQAAVVDPRYILHPDQLLLAAHKCLYDSRNQQMKTKSVFTELLYCLYPGKSIKDALATMGAQADSTAAIFVVLDNGYSEKMVELVQGELLRLEEVADLADVDLVRACYRIADDVRDEKEVLNCVLTKIASKELLM